MSSLLRVAVLTAVTLHALTATLQAADCPNVVLIISDDQTYSDFGFMGHPSTRPAASRRLHLFLST